MKLGIFGCGDFLRWQSEAIQNSKLAEVAKLYDPDKARAERFAADLGGVAVDDPEEIFSDSGIDLVLLFVPPWVRRDLFARAIATGKHTLLTKPLGSSASDCDEILRMEEESAQRHAVIYGRTGEANVETLKQLLDSGEVGSLGLYKQDWLHHYPQWNTWALDPAKNGGPFMDAMIHNLNAARYLMGRRMLRARFFSDNHAHADLPCNDTEFLKADFEDGGSAHLFITWAADLEVFSTEGNDREHIDQQFFVTDQGWYLKFGSENGQPGILGSKEDQKRFWPLQKGTASHFDRYITAIEQQTSLPGDLVSLSDAAFDVCLLRSVAADKGEEVVFSLSASPAKA